MMNTNENEWPELMTPDEVARVLRKSPAAVRYMLRNKMLAGVRIGRNWMIRKDEVRRVLAEGTQPVALAGGRVHPGRVIEDEADQSQHVDPDQLRLDLARRPGPGDQARRDPVDQRARIIG